MHSLEFATSLVQRMSVVSIEGSGYANSLEFEDVHSTPDSVSYICALAWLGCLPSAAIAEFGTP